MLARRTYDSVMTTTCSMQKVTMNSFYESRRRAIVRKSGKGQASVESGVKSLLREWWRVGLLDY